MGVMPATAASVRPAEPLSAPPPKVATPQRYVALDAYRGFVMILLASGGFGFAVLAHHPTFGRIAAWFDHVRWEGAVFWDLVQPAFMFIVGVAMPFGLGHRKEQGASLRQNLRHVAARSFKLILLSQILMWTEAGRFHFQLINVLSQIAFTYFLCFLIMQLKLRWQVLAAGLILAGHWALFVLFPGPDGAFSKTENIGAVIDRAIMGYNYSGHYVTINFVSCTVTTLFGAWTGTLLRTQKPLADKLKILATAAFAALAGALALSLVIPMIKRLWTASFALYSTGWVLLMFVASIMLIDVLGYRKLAFPLVVVGMNSIIMYSISEGLGGWLDRSLGVSAGRFQFNSALTPIAGACATLLVLWTLCYCLYRRKIFIKL